MTYPASAINLPKPPEHVAKPRLPFFHKAVLVFIVYIAFAALTRTSEAGLVLMACAGIVILVAYRVFAFKQCESCHKEYVPKSKTVCYKCWRESVDEEMKNALKS